MRTFAFAGLCMCACVHLGAPCAVYNRVVACVCELARAFAAGGVLRVCACALVGAAAQRAMPHSPLPPPSTTAHATQIGGRFIPRGTKLYLSTFVSQTLTDPKLHQGNRLSAAQLEALGRDWQQHVNAASVRAALHAAEGLLARVRMHALHACGSRGCNDAQRRWPWQLGCP